MFSVSIEKRLVSTCHITETTAGDDTWLAEDRFRRIGSIVPGQTPPSMAQPCHSSELLAAVSASVA